MFDQELKQAIGAIAEEHELDVTALLAVADVESGGKLYAEIKGRREPLIRFEGHYFYRLLPRAKRNRAVVEGLAHPVAGRVKNPLGQAARWKMLSRASAIDRPSALASTSWGAGQVMGAHWRWLGFASVDAFVAQARTDAAGQIRIMARFIVKAGLAGLLENRDWAGFARAYNGPGYHHNRYDRKLAEAFCRHGGEMQKPGRHDAALLRLGSAGPAVEQLQDDLRKLGYPLIADGDFGRATEAALKAFQAGARLKRDGVYGAKTMEAMMRKLPPAARAA